MTDPPTRRPRRGDALSRDRVIAAAIEILDQVGEGDLTVRGLTAHLSTGRGAVYHHVTGKDDLLAAATDQVISEAVEGIEPGERAAEAIRALALSIFDAIDAHPWVGVQLAREPLQAAVFRIWKSIGVQLRQLGVDSAALADAGSALVSYILGSAAQYAAGPRKLTNEQDRTAYLTQLVAMWTEYDPDTLVAEATEELIGHDDREQFLAGVDIFLAGITR